MNNLSMPRIFTFEMHQDDPEKCTSAKMRKMGFAKGIARQHFPRNALVLNPTVDNIVLNADRESLVQIGVVVIDCSWTRAGEVFGQRFKGLQRRLPALLAGNPTNYSKLGSLSSVEAVSACFYITNFKDQARRILSIYKWGETFLSLNHDPLEDYSKASSIKEIRESEISYFPYLALSPLQSGSGNSARCL
ncbi:MAG: DUF367 family protein [Nitrososphaerales archaeon]